MEEESLSTYFNKANNIEVTYNNKVIKTDKEDLLQNFNDMIEFSYFSPAFGVSIDELTKKEKQNGIWIEFSFEKQEEFGDLPFNKLLINIKPKYYGFNIIRFYENAYDGRCFYLNLAKPSTEFYNYLLSICK